MTVNDLPIRVVLADDHAVVRQGVRQFLESDGRIDVVAEAASGAEALRVVREHKPNVAVLDIQMPEQSGIEVTRLLRAEQFPVGILILTAFDDEPYVRAVLQAGANGYVLKTAEAQDIIDAVVAVSEGQSALDASLARKLMTRLAAPPEPTLEALTERELDVLRLAARGFTNKAIGMQLEISDRTVQGHLAKIYDKLQVASRTGAVMRAVSLGLIPPGLDQESTGA